MSDTPGPKITQKLAKLAELTLDPKNANKHTVEHVADIAKSLKRFGYLPTIVTRPNGQLIAGEGTFKALQLNGETEAKINVVAGLSEADYIGLALALNKLPEGSSWDEAVLREQLAGLNEMEDGLEGIGFTAAETEKILEQPDELEVRSIDTATVQDEFWISIRGPLAQQALVLQRLEESTKDLPEVNVELGTINVG